jgi:hypothetical protein
LRLQSRRCGKERCGRSGGTAMEIGRLRTRSRRLSKRRREPGCMPTSTARKETRRTRPTGIGGQARRWRREIFAPSGRRWSRRCCDGDGGAPSRRCFFPGVCERGMLRTWHSIVSLCRVGRQQNLMNFVPRLQRSSSVASAEAGGSPCRVFYSSLSTFSPVFKRGTIQICMLKRVFCLCIECIVR